MTQQLQRLLLVAYKYPPYAAVGGKRWAKLSKYLAREGVTVHVLTVPWPNEPEHALRDVSHERIRIHRIPSLAPNRLAVTDPEAPFARKRRKLYRKHIDRTPRAQDAAYWGPVVVPAAAWLVRRHRLQAIVVTGAPFMANYWMARGRRLLPDVPLVQEFRDPWLELPPDQLAKYGGEERVRRLERRVIDSADAIVTVTEGLSALMRAKTSTPVFTVTNGYDPEELPLVGPSRPRPFRLIHGGNLLVGRQEPLRRFLEAVAELAGQMPELELVFRGKFPADVRKEYAHLEDAGILKVLPPVPGPDFMRELDGSFAALQFNSEHFPYLVSTKIYEYGAVKRPVLSVNYGGEIDSLVRTAKLGKSVDAHDTASIRNALLQLHSEWSVDPAASSEPVGLDAFAYPHIADQYAALIDRTRTGQLL